MVPLKINFILAPTSTASNTEHIIENIVEKRFTVTTLFCLSNNRNVQCWYNSEKKSVQRLGELAKQIAKRVSSKYAAISAAKKCDTRMR